MRNKSNCCNSSSCCCNECPDSCIGEILSIICCLQSNTCTNNCLNCCDKPMLGCCNGVVSCNTRPIMLYGCDGYVWKMPTTKTNTECTTSGEECSNVFRLEKLNGCCATFRVLAPNPDTTSTNPYVSTDSLFTIDIKCICAVRCLEDTYVECL